jgi:DNA-3-methyladenine glycosylase II
MFNSPESLASQTAAPPYWDEACHHLMAHDRVLKKLIPRLREHVLHPQEDAFTVLAHSLVEQQVSATAARTIWQRLWQQCQPFTPTQLLAQTLDALRTTGLSPRKIDYLQGLAHHFSTQTWPAPHWHAWDDETVVQQLTAMKGIGRWTADMFLIFHLLRPNVLPIDDMGLLRAISVNYFSGEPVSRSEAREVAAAWSPYCSVATWYLWRSLETAPAPH